MQARGRQRLRVFFHLVAFVVVTSVVIYGSVFGLDSPEFPLKKIEVSGDTPDGFTQPVPNDSITRASGLRPNQDRLSEISLKQLEKKILSEPWVRKVRLSKQLPDKMSIRVQWRQPNAYLATRDGALLYVDEDGTTFGPALLSRARDLPIFFGLENNPGQIERGVNLVRGWARMGLDRWSQLSSVSWESTRGLRATALYSVMNGKRLVRAEIRMSQNFDTKDPEKLAYLGKVMKYLSENSVAVLQVLLNDGKKIVVKTYPGS